MHNCNDRFKCHHANQELHQVESILLSSYSCHFTYELITCLFIIVDNGLTYGIYSMDYIYYSFFVMLSFKKCLGGGWCIFLAIRKGP